MAGTHWRAADLPGPGEWEARTEVVPQWSEGKGTADCPSQEGEVALPLASRHDALVFLGMLFSEIFSDFLQGCF